MSDKVRVYEIAEEAGASSQDVIAKAKDLGVELKSPQSAVTVEDAEEIANYIITGKSAKLEKKAAPKAKKEVKKVVTETTKVTEEKETKVTEEKEIKTEIKKVETEVKTETKKETEIKKPVISKPKPVNTKTEEKKEESKPAVNPTNKNKIVPKRRGLKIVKKNNPKVEKPKVPELNTSEQSSKKPMKSLSEILGGNDQTESRKPNEFKAPPSSTDAKKAKSKKEEKTITKIS